MKKRVIFGNEHYVDSRENKALKKFKLVRKLNPTWIVVMRSNLV